MDKQTIATYFKDLQDSICAGLEEADGEGFFREDPWERAAGGGGRPQDGPVLRMDDDAGPD